MSILLLVIEIICAGIILVRCVCVASRMSRREFGGHPLQFLGLTASYTLIAGGSVGLLFGLPAAAWLLLVGVALWIVSDRRERSC